MKQAKDNKAGKSVGVFEQLIVDATPAKNAQAAMEHFVENEVLAVYRQILLERKWDGDDPLPSKELLEEMAAKRVSTYTEFEEGLFITDTESSRALLVTQCAESRLFLGLVKKFGVRLQPEVEVASAA